MTNYGILLVDTSWDNEELAHIDKAAYLHHGDHLGTSAKALIYVREPIDAVIAEAEVTGDIIETESPLVGQPQQEMAKTHLVPLKVKRLKDHTEPIPLARLRTLLGSDFSVYDETWIPLSEKQYRQITAFWEKKSVT